MLGCPEENSSVGSFTPPLNFGGFKEWALSVAKAIAIKARLFLYLTAAQGTRQMKTTREGRPGLTPISQQNQGPESVLHRMITLL